MLLEAMRVITEAVRKIIEAVRLFLEAVRVLVEALRVLQSLAIKSIPIDPRLRNNFLYFRFDLAKFWSYLIRIASIVFSDGLATSFFLRSCIVLDKPSLFC